MSIETKVVHRLEQTDLEIHVDTTYGNVKLVENGKEIIDLTSNDGKVSDFLVEVGALLGAAISTLKGAGL